MKKNWQKLCWANINNNHPLKELLNNEAPFYLSNFSIKNAIFGALNLLNEQ